MKPAAKSKWSDNFLSPAKPLLIAVVVSLGVVGARAEENRGPRMRGGPFNPERFAEHVKERTQHLQIQIEFDEARLNALKELKSCVSSAKDHPEMKICELKNQSQMSEIELKKVQKMKELRDSSKRN
jgi:hypothetical protein